MRETKVTKGTGGFQNIIEIGPHRVLADAPTAVAGLDSGPTPHELLCAALGACTAITIEMYARHKQWPLTNIDVRVAEKAEGDGHLFVRRIKYEGELTDEQRAKLNEVANKCPVHKILTGKVRVETENF